ncbi:calcium-activated chloride channel regulator 3A-1-like isoform X2 [Rhipicephalus microplus]|uniref:calcium-activated chloride channel regulator 3A-1-like isoform X2 n=1 Tax=Rhipicephalus microplus TaxID=6941 RepID=UPI003F6CF5B4
MFMPYVPNVSHFCDSTNGVRRHDPHAPSEQNAICQGRSTWEVISENKDFTNLARANMSKTIEVTFEETQHRDDLPPRVVLVLDLSRRMKGNNRMSFLKEAAKRYVQDIADESKRLAIITFSSTAAVRHPLMSVNVSTRPSFLNAVNDLRAAGPACIGCGLQQALQVLNSTDETPQGSMILLMSDDEENRKPKLYDVLPELTAAKVGVSTMAMGASADHQIEKLATMTGGKAFYFPALQRNTAILMKIAFEDSTNEEADNAYVRDGEWTIRLESPSLQEVEVNIQVKSQAKDLNDKPIRVTTLLDTLQVVKPHEAIIYAEVTKEYKIVLDATAVAEVIGPNSPNKTVVPLHEDGDDPDLRKNDGIYSGYFVQFTGKGRYVVTVYVSGNERTRLGVPRSHYPTNVIIVSPASAVDIRASKEMSKLRMEFEKQKQMTMADVVEGDLDPLPVGSKHEVTFLFTSEWPTRRPDGGFDWVIFLAARAVNSYGLKSGISRILEVIYSTPPMNTTVATTTAMATATEATTVTLPTTMKATTDGRSHLWVWFLVGGIAVVIAIVAVLVVLFRSRLENHSVYNRLVGRWRGDQPSSDRAVTYSQMA